jgi:hypothetical protein
MLLDTPFRLQISVIFNNLLVKQVWLTFQNLIMTVSRKKNLIFHFEHLKLIKSINSN